MAQPANQIGNFRARIADTVEAMRNIDAVLAIMEDTGGNDSERQAFLQASFGAATDNPDLDWAAFATGIVAMRAMRTAWQTNRIAIAKLLR